MKWRMNNKYTLIYLPVPALLAGPRSARDDLRPRCVGSRLLPMLEAQIPAPEVTAYQFRRYVLQKIPKLPATASAEQWTAEAARLRRRILNDVVFHGWHKEWVEAAPRFEDLGPIPSGKGYRMRKLRYQIVPGFESTAILYEPAT